MCLVRAALRAAGVPAERIDDTVRFADGKQHAVSEEEVQPLAVRQARVCEMLDCSRFHVRKLERLGLLKPVDLAGLKRYCVRDVLKLAGG